MAAIPFHDATFRSRTHQVRASQQTQSGSHKQNITSLLRKRDISFIVMTATHSAARSFTAARRGATELHHPHHKRKALLHDHGAQQRGAQLRQPCGRGAAQQGRPCGGALAGGRGGRRRHQQHERSPRGHQRKEHREEQRAPGRRAARQLRQQRVPSPRRPCACRQVPSFRVCCTPRQLGQQRIPRCPRAAGSSPCLGSGARRASCASSASHLPGALDRVIGRPSHTLGFEIMVCYAAHPASQAPLRLPSASHIVTRRSMPSGYAPHG